MLSRKRGEKFAIDSSEGVNYRTEETDRQE